MNKIEDKKEFWIHNLQMLNEVYNICEFIKYKLHSFEELYYITKNTCNLKMRKIYLQKVVAFVVKHSYLSAFVKTIAKLINCIY